MARAGNRQDRPGKLAKSYGRYFPYQRRARDTTRQNDRSQGCRVVSMTWGMAAIGYLRQFPFPEFLSIRHSLIGRTGGWWLGSGHSASLAFAILIRELIKLRSKHMQKQAASRNGFQLLDRQTIPMATSSCSRFAAYSNLIHTATGAFFTSVIKHLHLSGCKRVCFLPAQAGSPVKCDGDIPSDGMAIAVSLPPKPSPNQPTNPSPPDS